MKRRGADSLQNIVIVRNAYEWQYGGAEQFAYNFAICMRDESIKTTVVTRVPELISHCRQSQIPVFRNIWIKNETRRRWMLLYYALSPILVAQYIWVLLRARADLVVLTSRDDQIFGTMAAKLLGVPVVWFDHADMKHIVASPFRFLRRSYYYSLARATSVIIASQAELDKIRPNIDPLLLEKFTVINNGALRREAIPLPHERGKRIVAYVGRLDRDKGILDLVEAVRLMKTLPDVEFWIAGKGPDETKFRELISQYELGSSFKLLGHLDNVWSLLLAADLFVYPTHHDASPLAPVEALLAGVPVLATEIGGIPEVVPTTAGVLVPAHNPRALADGLTSILTNQERYNQLKSGALSIGSDLTFSSVLKRRYLPLFRSLLETKHENSR